MSAADEKDPLEELRRGAILLQKTHPEYAAMALEFADNLGAFCHWYEWEIMAVQAEPELLALREKRTRIMEAARDFCETAPLHLDGRATLTRLSLALQVFLIAFENALGGQKAPEALN